VTNGSSLLRIAYGTLSLPSRLRDLLYARRLRDYCDADSTATLGKTTTIHNPYGRAAVKIGLQTLFLGEVNLLREGALVEIGDWSFVGPGAKLWSMTSISIGSRVQISHGVHIFDNNSHSLSAAERSRGFESLRTMAILPREPVEHSAVRIEDDVWIGFNAAIMKGVTVGQGAVVGASSVVTKDVAPFTVVAGNPARKVGESRK
jgi:acetyltransferase-like isoleucine patch superfamily enzyme